MSKIAISPGATGAAVFTIQAPSTETSRTLTLPDATGTVQVSGNPISGTTGTFSGDLTLGSSTLATPTGSAPSYLCRAWVNFNGTGTVAIRASGNVSSITDNGTGDYTVNFTTAMPDTSYALCGFIRSDLVTPNAVHALTAGSSATKTTSAVNVLSRWATGGNAGLTDTTEIDVEIFR